MKRQGRPTVFTKLTLKKLEEAFAFGCTDKEACMYANISTAALYNYQSSNPEFVDRKQILKAAPVLKARMCVVKELETNPVLAFKYIERYLDQEVMEFVSRNNSATITSSEELTISKSEYITRMRDALDAIEHKGKYELIGNLDSTKVYKYQDFLRH
jgi:hypothetical protein